MAPAMLSNKIMIILAAVFGFLLAWLVKPSGSAVSASHDSGQNTMVNSVPRQPTVSGARPQPGQKKFDGRTHTPDGHELPPELIAARTEMAASTRTSLAVKDQGYVQRLAELLKLTVDQQQLLLNLYQQKRDAFNIFSPGQGVSHEKILEQAEAAETKFNTALAQLLSSEQIEQFNALRKQQAANRALAETQREFADVLGNIDISADQQNAILLALRDPAAAPSEKMLDKTGLFSETYDAMGFGVAGDGMSNVAAANAAILQSGNRTEIIRTMIDNRKKITAEKIERLRPHLSPAQLEQYGSLLQARDQSFFAAMAPQMQAPVPPELREK